MIISPHILDDEPLNEDDIAVLEMFESREKVLFSKSSGFHDVSVSENVLGRFLKFDDSYQAAQIHHDLYQGNFPYVNYFLLGMFWNQLPKNVLIAGLGSGKLAHDIYSYNNNADRIDVVELDNIVAKAAHEYFGFEQTEKIKLTVQDICVYTRNCTNKYDLTVLDVFSQDGLPYRLITEEFLKEVKSCMTPHGIVAANLFSLYDVNSDKNYIFKAALKTYKKVFKNVKVFLTDKGNDQLYVNVFGLKNAFRGLSNVILFASDEALDTEQLARNVKILQNSNTNICLPEYARDEYSTSINTDNFRYFTDEYTSDTEFTLENLFNYLYINHMVE